VETHLLADRTVDMNSLPERARELDRIYSGKIYDSDQYRLHSIDADDTRLVLNFSTMKYEEYFATSFVVHEELCEALRNENGNIKVVLDKGHDTLILRNEIIPTGKELASFDDRVCGGGVLVCLALAEPDSSGFKIICHRRTEQVRDHKRCLSVIPRGFHKATVDRKKELNPYNSVMRELYKELLGGADASGPIIRSGHDWYMYRPQMQWFCEHPNKYHVECTSFAINLLTGNYGLGILLVIDDPHYYEVHQRVEEFSTDEVEKQKIVSSLLKEEVSELILQPDWSPDGRMALIEGLRRLAQLYPDKVDLPDIQVLSPTA